MAAHGPTGRHGRRPAGRQQDGGPRTPIVAAPSVRRPTAGSELWSADMRRISTGVLVIGGGATGTGILRDLAMRGFDALLVEQRDLSHGTSGRYHGLLHSGGRYAVKDPKAAEECIEENRVLRRIMPHCIEDTGGFFVVTPEDDLDYVPRFVEGCRHRRDHLRGDPGGSRRWSRSRSSTRRSSTASGSPTPRPTPSCPPSPPSPRPGSTAPTCSPTTGSTSWSAPATGWSAPGATTWSSGEQVEIAADMVVNASGAWAGRIAAGAGIHFEVLAGKGTMVAMNHRMVNTVLNRCKMPDDGDIIVPIHTVAVIGTTDERVSDPERFSIEPWEVRLMLEEGEKLVPGISKMRVLRAWAGVRPLYQETSVDDTRDVTRAYALLDHAKRDGVEGFVTMTGGKWTTFRQMAEVCVDEVCRKLGVRPPVPHPPRAAPRRRRLAAVPLAGPTARPRSRRQRRTATSSASASWPPGTRWSTPSSRARRRPSTTSAVTCRVGMGPCQGGWCAARVTGLIHELRSPPVEDSNVALRDFLQERWKGLLPILWGSQLRQERLDELIHLSVLNVPDLPGPGGFGAGVGALPGPARGRRRRGVVAVSDVVVLGAGPAGLMAGLAAQRQGARVRVHAKGWGLFHWHAGCVDVLGHHPVPAGDGHVASKRPVAPDRHQARPSLRPGRRRRRHRRPRRPAGAVRRRRLPAGRFHRPQPADPHRGRSRPPHLPGAGDDGRRDLDRRRRHADRRVRAVPRSHPDAGGRQPRAAGRPGAGCHPRPGFAAGSGGSSTARCWRPCSRPRSSAPRSPPPFSPGWVDGDAGGVPRRARP